VDGQTDRQTNRNAPAIARSNRVRCMLKYKIYGISLSEKDKTCVRETYKLPGYCKVYCENYKQLKKPLNLTERFREIH